MKYRSLIIAGALVTSSAFAQFTPKLGTSAPPSDSSSEGSVTAASGDGTLKAYVGFDYVNGTFSNSASNSSVSTVPFTSDFNMLRFRGGYRFFDAVAAEVQYGTSIGSGANKAEVENYYAFLLVPTATVFDTFELSFPVGISKIEVKQGGQSYADTDISYGVQADLPLKQFADVPDLRLGGGFVVYHAGNSTRTYGFNIGLRYDFDAGQFEIVNPITAVKNLFTGGSDAKSDDAAAPEPAPASEPAPAAEPASAPADSGGQ